MTDVEDAIDKFIRLRQDHRDAREVEEATYYKAQAAKAQLFRRMGLDPYVVKNMARVGDAIKAREQELEGSND